MSKHLPPTCAAMLVCISAVVFGAGSQDVDDPGDVELARHETESSSARIEPARLDEQEGIAIVFTGTHDLHYYANPQPATAPGFELKVAAKSDGFDFGKPIFPKWEMFNDPTGSRVEVYAGDFTVFVPITGVKDTAAGEQHDVEVLITGQACTSKICLLPFEKTLKATVDWSRRGSWTNIALESGTAGDVAVEKVTGPDRSMWLALALAFAAGLALNIMPCVWPVLPIVIMRIVDQAKHGRRQAIMMGLAFCLGILLFFATLATANIVLQSFYDKTLNWGDHLRNPTIVTALSLLMIVMALFMFGIFTFAVPSSIASKSGSGKGYTGSIGMGFLAAILSTPCSFGLLTVAFVWAQGRPLALGTLAIMVIGLGMAAPYAILTSVPGWLGRLPRGGRWMELFKQTLGFVLLIIAVKLIKAVPDANKINLLYFAVILSFGVWVWGTWTPYGTKLSRKWLVRGITVLLVVSALWFFFKPELVDWQDYDTALIESAKSEDTPVLIKFTADWCTNCEVVDKFVYQRKDIAKLIDDKGVLAIKGDTTRSTQAARIDLENIYNEPGVPVTILWLPEQTEPVRLHELFFDGELKELLEALPDKDQTKTTEGAW
ncbi:MAG: thioredoxin family protein [Phycisphaerales bacterium]|nr:MAG: thioredoxin family protein [Phycisphaerales bacterium]